MLSSSTCMKRCLAQWKVGKHLRLETSLTGQRSQIVPAQLASTKVRKCISGKDETKFNPI